MDGKENNPEAGFTRIKPVAIDLTANSAVDNTVTTRKAPIRQILVWLSLAALLAAAALVIFLLPGWIAPPVLVPDQSPAVAGNGQPVAATATVSSADSPWEKAQESTLRQETQEILEQILDAKKDLDEHGVTIWAGQEYAQALQSAKSGDELYNQRDFAGARLQYDQALTIFKELQERVDIVFNEAIGRGKKALADGDSDAALKAFDLALTIDSLDRTAAQGRERAEKLDEVLALLKQGDGLLEDGKLEEAQQVYRRVVDLDDQSDRARQQIAVVGQRIQDRQFNDHMSDGFNALYNDQLEKAQQAFTGALKLKPSSAEARSALNQSHQQITARNISSLLAQAQTLETGERWQEALKKYSAALELDPGLAAAQAGKERTAVRAQTHEQLEQILAHPERLYDGGVLDETEAFYRKIRALANPGPVLSVQLDRLEQLLSRMSTPVSVQLLSDNLTTVTLYKVGELGYFASREISLRPGRYVAVGIREGYRDVRVEFTVDPDTPPPVIKILADDKISFGDKA